MNQLRTRAGFTLLEVLVTVVILSLGMLGVAGVLLLVHKNNASSYMEQQAVQQAYDIIDRMRANRSAALQGLYDGATTPSTTPSTPANNCSSGACTPQQMAKYDLWQWQTDLANVLPAAASSISTATPAGVSSANQDVQVTVTLHWSDAPALQALKQAVKPASYTLTTVL